MKKKYIVIFIALILVYLIFSVINKQKKENEVINNEENKIEEIKSETGVVGDSNLYEVSKDESGNQMISIKADLQYKVALAGVLAHEEPSTSNLDEYLLGLSQERGIWIEEKSREKFLKLLNDVSQAGYHINEKGYLQIDNKEKDQYSKKIDKSIRENKLIRIAIISSYYTLDSVTGKVGEFPYEDADPYQIYEYFQAENESLLLITTNKKKSFSNKEIVDEILQVLYN